MNLFIYRKLLPLIKTARYCELRGVPISKEISVNKTIDVNIKPYEPVSIILQND